MADFFNPIGQTIELALNNCKQQIRKGELKDNSPYIASSIGLLELLTKLARLRPFCYNNLVKLCFGLTQAYF